MTSTHHLLPCVCLPCLNWMILVPFGVKLFFSSCFIADYKVCKTWMYGCLQVSASSRQTLKSSDSILFLLTQFNDCTHAVGFEFLIFNKASTSTPMCCFSIQIPHALAILKENNASRNNFNLLFPEVAILWWEEMPHQKTPAGCTPISGYWSCVGFTL